MQSLVLLKGFSAEKVYEIHGSIHHMQCNSCSTVFSADEYQVKYDPTSFEAKEPLPTCQSCKKLLRPNILMFGDYEFDDSRCHKQSVLFQDFVNNLGEKDSLVVMEFGAGHAVPTIRYLGEQLLHNKKCDTKLIRINLRDFDAPIYSSSFAKSKLKDFMAFADTALNFTTELKKCLN